MRTHGQSLAIFKILQNVSGREKRSRQLIPTKRTYLKPIPFSDKVIGLTCNMILMKDLQKLKLLTMLKDN